MGPAPALLSSTFDVALSGIAVRIDVDRSGRLAFMNDGLVWRPGTVCSLFGILIDMEAFIRVGSIC